MATISLTFTGETPTGVSVTALTRSDTGATVAGVSLPAAMTLAAGSWNLTFTEPADGLHYDYSYTVTWSDTTTSTGMGSITGAAADTYSTDSDVDNAYGPDNVTAWADLNSNGDADEIAARKAWARGEAKILIDEELAGTDLDTPATVDGFRFFSSLRSIEAELAGVLLYQSRGIRDQQSAAGDADGAMQGHYDRAMARLAKRIADHVELDDDDDTGTPGAFQFVPIRRGSASDEYSSN